MPDKHGTNQKNYNLPRTLGRMKMTTERVFRKVDTNLFREYNMYFINFLNEDGTLRSQKLDKEVRGGLWRVATDKERSAFGECLHLFPDTDTPVRLICIKLT